MACVMALASHEGLANELNFLRVAGSSLATDAVLLIIESAVYTLVVLVLLRRIEEPL